MGARAPETRGLEGLGPGWTARSSHGGHAAGWETSHLLALHPQAVDLGALPPKGEPVLGVGGPIPPQDSTAEFGAEILAAAAEAILREVRDRLDNRGFYRQNGCSMVEGRWKATAGG